MELFGCVTWSFHSDSDRDDRFGFTVTWPCRRPSLLFFIRAALLRANVNFDFVSPIIPILHRSFRYQTSHGQIRLYRLPVILERSEIGELRTRFLSPQYLVQTTNRPRPQDQCFHQSDTHRLTEYNASRSPTTCSHKKFLKSLQNAAQCPSCRSPRSGKDGHIR
jgi:hypothetical protein